MVATRMSAGTLVMSAGVLLLSQSADAQESAAASRGGLLITTVTNVDLPVAATGTTCGYANAAGTLGGPATFIRNPPPPVPCAIFFTTPPFRALGPLVGLGHQGPNPPIAKFPPPPGTGGSDLSRLTSAAGSVFVSGSGMWVSTEVISPLSPLFDTRDATLTGRANVKGAPGLAAGRSKDPWFFTPTVDESLDLTVTLEDVEVSAVAGPNETAAAALEVSFAFGTGTVAGANATLFKSFTRTVTQDDSPFTLNTAEMLSTTLQLQAGQTYWLTAEIDAGAVTTATPEPQTLGLTIIGLLVAGTLSAHRRRGTTNR